MSNVEKEKRSLKFKIVAYSMIIIHLCILCGWIFFRATGVRSDKVSVFMYAFVSIIGSINICILPAFLIIHETRYERRLSQILTRPYNYILIFLWMALSFIASYLNHLS